MNTDRDFEISLTCGMMGTDLSLDDFSQFENFTYNELSQISYKMSILLTHIENEIKDRL